MPLIVEVCTDTPAGVRAAVAAGVARVELCSALAEGGLTPSWGLLHQALAAADGQLAVHVLLRPRSGDFLYDADDLAVLARDLALLRGTGIAGVALGVLDAGGAIDRHATAALVQAARPLAVTFHRAFDLTPEPLAALDTVIELGIERVLTSGQASSAPAGAPLIRSLVSRAAGRVAVVPAGGIDPTNVAALLAATGATELHFSAGCWQPDPLAARRAAVALGHATAPEAPGRRVTSEARIRAILAATGRNFAGRTSGG